MFTVWFSGIASSAFAEQTGMLLAAFLLCSLIGLERQMRQKSAGYRTHVLVGLGACLFTLVSAYGFKEVLGHDVSLDPSRIAAQVVSGIGFLGAGVIFKGRNMVRGLTTASTVWVSAAVGMACGAGMVPLAAVMTLLLLIILLVIAPVLKLIPNPDRRRLVKISYLDGSGVLRDILRTASDLGFSASIDKTRRITIRGKRAVAVDVRFFGKPPLRNLLSALAELDGVERLELRGTVVDSDDDTADTPAAQVEG
ncbi:MgtC/SapB family protein [Brevibacterium sp. 50QC2O2]|jgi:putative Mg2+ transporter-C (MgtC) family protein|uniref:MgtC/SapB family protein n=1 Tax=Brevibacterium TaxID=1696 RepID=UPI00211BCA1D|nr:MULTISPECIES: MgtC/SapB family protein [unclassified Brevibacterium]MCQ9369413.1 MgtC/SapB family protein [Brevibacterium sp. 91QC2O2]MCQ9386762.1 MgtC/SapB family protein [Brevibacterium sp. 68QC2CO]MCQ9389652.1 MgtC/SapB family protein [Brevibacterium sp. 50QC2O2]